MSYARFGADRGQEAQDGIETAPLMRALRRYCAVRGVEADWGEMQGLPPAVLVNLLAMMCPFQPAEKQALLEALTLRKRGARPRHAPRTRRARRRRRGRAHRAVGPRMADDSGGVDRKLLEILVCPLTKGPLRYDRERQELISDAARLAYPIRDGIPIMLIDEARSLDDPSASGA